MTQNIDFHGYSSFTATNSPDSWPFKSENNAHTIPKQPQNNYEIDRKIPFLAP